MNRRFFCPPEAGHGTELTLPEQESHHAARVLRLQPGDRVTVLDGQGGSYRCEIRSISRKRVDLTIQERVYTPPLPYQITLVQSIPKGKAMDLIIQQATELGAHRIVPVFSEHGVVQLSRVEAFSKSEKWRAIAVEAIKQCGAAWLPRVETPLPFETCLTETGKSELSMVAGLKGTPLHPREVFRRFEREHNRVPRTVAVWIGPEGDFSDRETKLLVNQEIRPVSLGPHILRTETAALCALSVIGYELRSDRQAESYQPP